MLRTTLATLRQPRYAALSAVMLFVAIACVGAGTWQIVRFDDKVRANDALTGNAHDAPVGVHDLLPLVGGGRLPGADDVRYRTVTATGRYDSAHQALVRLQTVNDTQGYYVETPLTTATGTLLVVRGFVAERSSGSPPPSITPAPAGVVTVRARAQTGDTRHDSPGGLPAGQLVSINPADQAARLGTAMYDGYAELERGQPGTAGLTAIPPPDLSNPAGGAVEPQHFAYIIQWYLFALLALAAPLAMARAERREQSAADGNSGAGTGTGTGDAATDPHEVSDDDRRAARLADRYGRLVH